MNTIKKIIILIKRNAVVRFCQQITAIIIFSFTSFFCHAQSMYRSPSEQLAHNQSALKNTAFIFEGIAVQQKSYRTKQGANLTCSVIKITKIFKGNPQIKLGSIKVITDQGSSEDEWAIGMGFTYILMGNLADSSILASDMTATDNPTVLLPTECIQIADPKI